MWNSQIQLQHKVQLITMTTNAVTSIAIFREGNVVQCDISAVNWCSVTSLCFKLNSIPIDITPDRHTDVLPIIVLKPNDGAEEMFGSGWLDNVHVKYGR